MKFIQVFGTHAGVERYISINDIEEIRFSSDPWLAEVYCRGDRVYNARVPDARHLVTQPVEERPLIPAAPGLVAKIVTYYMDAETAHVEEALVVGWRPPESDDPQADAQPIVQDHGSAGMERFVLVPLPDGRFHCYDSMVTFDTVEAAVEEMTKRLAEKRARTAVA